MKTGTASHLRMATSGYTSVRAAPEAGGLGASLRHPDAAPPAPRSLVPGLLVASIASFIALAGARRPPAAGLHLSLAGRTTASHTASLQ